MPDDSNRRPDPLRYRMCTRHDDAAARSAGPVSGWPVSWWRPRPWSDPPGPDTGPRASAGPSLSTSTTTPFNSGTLLVRRRCRLWHPAARADGPPRLIVLDRGLRGADVRAHAGDVRLSRDRALLPAGRGIAARRRPATSSSCSSRSRSWRRSAVEASRDAGQRATARRTRRPYGRADMALLCSVAAAECADARWLPQHARAAGPRQPARRITRQRRARHRHRSSPSPSPCCSPRAATAGRCRC